MEPISTLQPESTEEMAKQASHSTQSAKEFPEGKVARREFLSTQEAEDVLANFGAREKSDYINKAIVEYWAVTEGEKMPLVSKEMVDRISKKLAAQLRKDLEIS